jgi:hypothetical protein
VVDGRGRLDGVIPVKICSIEGCDLTASVHGMCWGHDKQVKRGVAIHPVAQRKHRRGSQVPWLHAHVNHEGDECLKWPFAFHRDGRGQVTIDGQTRQAHRVMCKLAHGEPPTPDHEAAHTCGKGHEGCVNPRHLAWKTHTDNLADTLEHGTRVWGERHPFAILTLPQVLAIRGMAKAHSQAEVSRAFGLQPGHVGKIVNRQLWRHA